MSTGVDVPTGLRERIADGLSNRKSFRASRSVRKATAPAQGGVVTSAGAACAVLIAAAGALWALQPQKTAPVAPPVQSQVTEVETKPTASMELKTVAKSAWEKPLERPADWHFRWTFEAGVPADLLVMKGNWNWNRATKSMEIPQNVAILPAHLLGPDPLLITAHGEALDVNRRLFHTLTLEGNDRKLVPIHRWERRELLVSRTVKLDCYFYHRRAVLLMNDRPGLVVEFNGDVTDAAMVLQFDNYNMRDLIATPVSETDLPDFVKNPEPIIKDMSELK